MDDRPVIVVGAGPVGLTMALSLAAQGVRSVVLDDDETFAREGSRSICVQAHTLAIAGRLGCGRIAAEGVSWHVGHTYYRGRQLFQNVIPDVGAEELPRFVNIPQSRVEEILLEAVEASPLTEVAWRHRVTGLEQDASGVTVHAAGPQGSTSVRGSYAVGCDGGRSAIRQLTGIGFPGEDHVDRFLIADVRADLPFPNERRFFFDPPFNPGRQVLVHPQPDGVWRVDWQVARAVDVDHERRSGALDLRIRAAIGDVAYRIVWVSSYVFHQRLAQRFRSGRVFLAGDAAHLMSVFGARGMNSGMQDADNLGWKLALVLAGKAPDALLDSYDHERRAAAAENLRITGRTMRFMAPPSWRARVYREAVLRGAARIRALRRFVDSGRLSEPFVYRDSPIVTGAGAGSSAGEVAHNVPVTTLDGVPGRLAARVGPGFLAVLAGDGHGAARAFGDAAAALEVPTEIVTAASYPGAAAGTLVLVRPDAHVAELVPGCRPGQLGGCVARACAGA
ncbi:MAG: FAD-dependent monooxygenase [Streptomycetales bacterium]